jgi:hypothetical protein
MSHEATQRRPFKDEASRLASAYRQAKTVLKRQDILFALGLVGLAADGAVDNNATRLLGLAKGIERMQYAPKKNENDNKAQFTADLDFEPIMALLQNMTMLWAKHPEAVSVTSVPNDGGSHRFELSIHPDDTARFRNNKKDDSFMWVVTDLINRITMQLYPQIKNVVIDIHQNGIDDPENDIVFDQPTKAEQFNKLLQSA